MDKINNLAKSIVAAWNEYGVECLDVVKALANMLESHIELDCPNCGKDTLFRHHSLLNGPCGGLVACYSCEYRRGSYQFIGEQMIKVEPLPEATSIIYYKKEG